MPNYRFEYNDINYVVFSNNITSCVVYDIKKDMDIMHIPNLIKNPKYSINSPMYFKLDDFTNFFINDILPKTSIKKFVLLDEKYHSLSINNNILYTKQDGHIHSLLAIPPKLNINELKLPNKYYDGTLLYYRFCRNKFIKTLILNNLKVSVVIEESEPVYLENIIYNNKLIKKINNKWIIKK